MVAVAVVTPSVVAVELAGSAPVPATPSAPEQRTRSLLVRVVRALQTFLVTPLTPALILFLARLLPTLHLPVAVAVAAMTQVKAVPLSLQKTVAPVAVVPLQVLLSLQQERAVLEILLL